MEEVYFRGGRINKLESIRMLLDAGADPNTEVSFRGTQEPLLLETVRRRQRDLVTLLLDYGADPNRQRIEDGQTALLVASQVGDIKLVRLLVARGAEVNRPNKAGQTPLFLARTPEIARYLIEQGASLGAQDELGRTALFPQAERANVDNVRLLLEEGLEVNHRDLTGRTPLIAAVSGHWDVERVEAVVRLLLEHGADPTVVNDDGLRAVDIATQEGKYTIVTLLSEATAR
jgi:ankyrin repeat protein